MLDDADGKPVNRTCLMLVDPSITGHIAVNASSHATFWCCLNGSGLGPGWLPLRQETAAWLLETAGSIVTNRHAFYAYKNLTDDGYAVTGPIGHCNSSCPQIPGFGKLTTPLLPRSLRPGDGVSDLNQTGVELLGHVHSAPTLDSAGSCTFFVEAAGAALITYASALGKTGAAWDECVIGMDCSYESQASLGNAKGKSAFGSAAPVGYYPALQ